MDKPKSRCNDPGRDRAKKCAGVSTDRDRPSEAARTGSLRDTCRLGDIPVLRCQIAGNEEFEEEHLVMAQNIRKEAGLSLMWESPSIMAYLKQGDQYMNSRRFGALPSHMRASKILYAERSRTTMYEA